MVMEKGDRVDDGNPSNLFKNEEVLVERDNDIGFSTDSGFKKLIVFWVTRSFCQREGFHQFT